VAGELHGDTAGQAEPFHVPNSRAAQVMRDAPRKAGGVARDSPGRTEIIRPALSRLVRDKAEWFKAFTALQDPVAHRVPLYAMPGVIREGSEEAAKQIQLRQEVAAAIEAKDFDELSRKLFESLSVGTYEPWFTQYGPGKFAIRDIRQQIELDHSEFLALGEAVLASLFE
jgi:hypothetical protein